MDIHYVYEDGTKVPDGVCLRALSQRTRLVVEIDSMDAISPSVVMNLLKTRWGCREVTIESVKVTCKGYTKNAVKVKN